jgi:mono/diheme cytochrome c family protein
MNRFSFRVSAALVALMVFGLTTLVAAQTKTPSIRKVPAVQTNPTLGSEMYSTYCGACHGRAGKGDGPAAVAMNPKPTDLTLLAKHYGGSVPIKEFTDKISSEHMTPAHGNSEMPVWGPIFRRLGNDDLRLYNLKKYIDSLQVQ